MFSFFNFFKHRLWPELQIEFAYKKAKTSSELLFTKLLQPKTNSLSAEEVEQAIGFKNLIADLILKSFLKSLTNSNVRQMIRDIFEKTDSQISKIINASRGFFAHKESGEVYSKLYNEYLIIKLQTNNKLLPQELEHLSYNKDFVFSRLEQQNNREILRQAFEDEESDIHHIVHFQRGIFPISNSRGTYKCFLDAYMGLTTDLNDVSKANPSATYSAKSSEDDSYNKKKTTVLTESRCIILRIGDHYLLRDVMDVYDRPDGFNGLTERFTTSGGGHKGVISVFEEGKAPRVFQNRKYFTFGNKRFSVYCKNAGSALAISEKVSELKH